MKVNAALSLALLCLCTIIAPSQGSIRVIDVAPVEYHDVEGFVLEGYKAMPDLAMNKDVPAVVIVPDWDGVNTYEQQRATLLAEMGYVGFAADIYGMNDHFVEAERRGELATLYRKNVTLFVQRIKAAVDLVKTMDGVDPDNVAVIGYCWGGSGVLEYALTGQDDVKALVSFHGGLAGISDAGPAIVPKLLVISGGDDDTSTDIVDLENTLGAANASWEITRFSGIEHAFTVFSDPRYDVWADTRSWHSMSKFLAEAFGITAFEGNKPANFDVAEVNYTDVNGKELRGYLSLPESTMDNNKTIPTVIIIPDWDGVNTYEKERATILALEGYIGFAADIYGSDLQEGLNINTRIEQATLYRSDPELFVQRIQRAVDLVKTFPEVDADNLAVIGYCFGGTGVIEYAFTGAEGIKVAVSFHGGHQALPQPMVNITPYVLVLSGGIDDAHGNQTEMEAAFNERDTSWEISRYAKVDHGYTSWSAGAYNLMADARSWESMMSTFGSIMPVEGNVMEVKKPEFAPEEEDDSSGAVALSSNMFGVLAISAAAAMMW